MCLERQKQCQVRPFFQQWSNLIGGFIAEFQFPMVKLCIYFWKGCFPGDGVAKQRHVDACLNEPFGTIQKPSDFLRFVFPAFAVAKVFDAGNLMLAAQFCNGKAFRPVEGVDDHSLILPLCVGFQHEV